MVISQQGIAATSQPLASQAAAQILARGGSAADAAIAANAVLGVVEPMMNGMGGDLFVLYRDGKTGNLTGLNASGPAPRALSCDFLAAQGATAMPSTGIHTVTVPGAVDGWAKMHERFGRLPWSSLFESAIAYAECGFPVSEVVRELWAAPDAVDKLQALPETAGVFLPDNKPPKLGDLFRNCGLAAAYRMVAARRILRLSIKARLAAAILKTSRRLGGTMTADDLASYSAEWVEPISIDYRGWRVFELPPNGQGMAALEMLNIMETIPADPEAVQRGGNAPAHRGHEARLRRRLSIQRGSAELPGAG